MKRFIPVLIGSFIFLSIVHVQAQVEKGKFLVGARSDLTALFNTNNTEITQNGNTEESEEKNNQFGLTPTVGYFIANGFAAGLFLDLSTNNLSWEQELEDGSIEDLNSSSSTFKAGPFIRYYFDMEKVKPFAHVQFGIGSNNLTYDEVSYDFSDPLNPKVVIEETKRKYALSTWGIGAGAAFFITNNVSIDVMLGYSSNTKRYTNDDSDYELNIRTGGFGLDVGFNIVIP